MKLFTFRSITMVMFKKEDGFIRMLDELELKEYETVYKVIASTPENAKKILNEKESRDVYVSHAIDQYLDFDLIQEEELVEGMILLK